jgi:hypothetical protein
MKKIEEIAEKTRKDLRQWLDKTKKKVNSSLNLITEQL